jgi:hypothetical protein
MHGRTGWKGKRPQLGLGLVLLAATLVIVAAALGSTSDKPAGGTTHAKSGAGGFGETYKASPTILRKTLFNAKLRPC